MFSLSLFLGFPVSASYSEALAKIDPQIIKMFISDNEDSYLNEVTFEGTQYIGKYVGEVAALSELELLQQNIYSILNKMIPNHTCESVPLVLFAAPSHSNP